MRAIAAGLSDVGLQREHNEDSFVVLKEYDLYVVGDGLIQLLTRDHSLINDYLLAMPDLTEEQKSELPKNVITRALGMQDQVVVDLQHDDPKPGDVYVLCSDGLSGMVTDEDIQKIVA